MVAVFLETSGEATKAGADAGGGTKRVDRQFHERVTTPPSAEEMIYGVRSAVSNSDYTGIGQPTWAPSQRDQSAIEGRS